MKVRFGFVSNSSSSSFAIYGKYCDTEKLLNKLNVTNVDINQFLEDCDYFCDNYYKLQKHFKDTFGLEFLCNYEDPEQCYIGISYEDLPNYQSTSEFFKKAEDVLGKNCEFICEEIQE